MRLGEIAARLSCTLEGDAETEIRGVAPIDKAEEGELSFLVNKKYFAEFSSTRAAALIVGEDFDRKGKQLLRHPNPYLAFARAIELFTPRNRPTPGIHATACISPTASIGSDVHLGPYCLIADRARVGDRSSVGAHSKVLEGAEIGEDTIIHSGVVIRERVRIGKNCVIQDNAVIGSDGFGYAQQGDKAWYPIVQAGTVVVEENVDIGACTTIDRAAMGETRIGAGTKIDNLVQIGHGCQIGKDCLICAQVGLAGSTKVGDNVILAGQVGAAGHLTIGNGAIITPQSGLAQSVEPGKVVSGSPAVDHKKWLKNSVILEKLPELKKALQELQIRLGDLENRLNKPHEAPHS